MNQTKTYWQNSNLVNSDNLTFWVSVLLALFIKPDDHECRKRKKSPIVTSTTYNYSFLKIPALCFFLTRESKILNYCAYLHTVVLSKNCFQITNQK